MPQNPSNVTRTEHPIIGLCVIHILHSIVQYDSRSSMVSHDTLRLSSSAAGVKVVQMVSRVNNSWTDLFAAFLYLVEIVLV